MGTYSHPALVAVVMATLSAGWTLASFPKGSSLPQVKPPSPARGFHVTCLMWDPQVQKQSRKTLNLPNDHENAPSSIPPSPPTRPTNILASSKPLRADTDHIAQSNLSLNLSRGDPPCACRNYCR